MTRSGLRTLGLQRVRKERSGLSIYFACKECVWNEADLVPLTCKECVHVWNLVELVPLACQECVRNVVDLVNVPLTWKRCVWNLSDLVSFACKECVWNEVGLQGLWT